MLCVSQLPLRLFHPCLLLLITLLYLLIILLRTLELHCRFNVLPCRFLNVVCRRLGIWAVIGLRTRPLAVKRAGVIVAIGPRCTMSAWDEWIHGGEAVYGDTSRGSTSTQCHLKRGVMPDLYHAFVG